MNSLKDNVYKLYVQFKKLKSAGFYDIFASSVINKVFSFLSSIIVVRILTKLEYGLFTYVWNIYNLFMLVNGIGLDSGFLQLASEREGDDEYRRNLFGFCIRTGNAIDLILSITIALFGIFAPLKIKGASTNFVLISLLPFFNYCYRIISVDLRVKKENRKYAHFTNINTFFVMLCTIGGAYFFKDKGLIVGYYIAYILTFIDAYVVIKEPLN